MFVHLLGTFGYRKAILGLNRAVDRTRSDQFRFLLGYAEMHTAGRALSPLAGIGVLSPKTTAALTSHLDRHSVPLESAQRSEKAPAVNPFTVYTCSALS